MYRNIYHEVSLLNYDAKLRKCKIYCSSKPLNCDDRNGTILRLVDKGQKSSIGIAPVFFFPRSFHHFLRPYCQRLISGQLFESIPLFYSLNEPILANRRTTHCSQLIHGVLNEEEHVMVHKHKC